MFQDEKTAKILDCHHNKQINDVVSAVLPEKTSDMLTSGETRDVYSHIPVLLKESIQGLAVESGKFYIDGTFGRGGHTKKILEACGPNGGVIALDRDIESVEYGKKVLEPQHSNLKVLHFRFSQMQEAWEIGKKIIRLAKKIRRSMEFLLDVGVSSPQLNQECRGFFFSKRRPLRYGDGIKFFNS